MSITARLTFDTITCCYAGCGITFAVPQWWLINRKEDHILWSCPNGHRQHFDGETDAEKYKREAGALRAKLDQEEMASRTARLERDKAQKANKRLRARAKAGVCSFCGRTFSQLARHMECKHGGVKA